MTDGELRIGSHHFVPVRAPSGTFHGLHCIRCGLDCWRRCRHCSSIVHPLREDDHGFGNRAYCTDQCRRAARSERAKARRAERKAMEGR